MKNINLLFFLFYSVIILSCSRDSDLDVNTAVIDKVVNLKSASSQNLVYNTLTYKEKVFPLEEFI